MNTNRAAERIFRPGMLPGLLEAAIEGRVDPDSGAGPARRTTRDWVVDGLCVLLAAAMGVIGMIVPTDGRPTSSAQSVVSSVALVIACGALMLRRTYAVTLAVVLICTSVWLPTVSGASVIALFTVAVHRRLSIVLGLVALAAGSAVLQVGLGQGFGGISYWTAVAGTGLITLLVAGWGVAVRGRRELVLLMADRMRRLEAEQEAQLQRARQAVRDGIARDMHDSLAHRLSLISMSAGALRYRGSVPPDDLEEMVGIVRTNAELSLTELRKVVSVLRRPEGQPEAARTGMVEDLVAQAQESGQQVRCFWRVPHRQLSPVQNEAIFRMVQEGLSNARKHAPDQEVAVSGAVSGDLLRVEMINCYEVGGTGDVQGSGLVGMAERTHSSGGELATSREAGRFRLLATWPIAIMGGRP